MSAAAGAPDHAARAELLPFDDDADRLLTAFVTMLASAAPERFEHTLRSVLLAFRRYFDVDGMSLRLGTTVVEVGDLSGPRERIARVSPRGRGSATLEVTGIGGRPVTPAALSIARAVVSSAAVVADRISTSRRLEHLTSHDELTGLLNRAAFGQRLESWVEQNPGRIVALLSLDIDRTTAVNATYGTEAGDELLRQVAIRLVEVLGPDVVVGRLGGDEFTALLPDLEPGPALLELADRVQAAVQRPVSVVPGHSRQTFGSDAHDPGTGRATRRPSPVVASSPPRRAGESAEVVRTATLGFAAARARASAPAELVWGSTQAALVGKRRGGAQTVVYDASMRRADEIRGEVELRLPRAIAGDEFVLYYQPEVDLRTTEVLGAEALVRWNHPTLGLLLPDTFIETVETSPYALSFGRWVLEHACAQWAQWARRFGWDGDVLPRVRVNVTPSQLMDAEFVATVAATLHRTGMPGSGLGLEITERDVVRDQRAAERTLRGLTALGVTVAIDDFGTGYSSFAQLRQFTVSSLKIDRRFVKDLCDNADDRSIVTAMVSLARSLDLDVVAEGVQDVGAAQRLVAMGCHRGQGFLYSRPVPADQMAEVLVAGSTGTH